MKARTAGLKELVNVTEKNIPMIHAALATTRDYLETHPIRRDGFCRHISKALKSLSLIRNLPNR